jgi:hypothetical protein
MQNVPSITELEFFSDEELERLPLDQLGAIYGEAKDLAAKIAANKKRLTLAIQRRFSDELDNVTTGTTTIVRGNVELKVTTPKRVTWDQAALASMHQHIYENWDDDPNDYIQVKYSISENAYKNWPQSLQEKFIDARVVTPGPKTLEFRDLQNRGGE